MPSLQCEAPRAGLHQGAVFTGVPVAWLPREITLVRPAGRSHEFVALRDAPDAFADPASDGMETMVAVAKVRPVIVVSPGWEIESGSGVRVLPVYSWTSATDAERDQVVAGDRPALLHLSAFRRLHDGVVKLHQQQSVYIGHLRQGRHVASLTSDSLAELLGRLARYAVILDDRVVTAPR